MDKLTKYQMLVKEGLETYAQLLENSVPRYSVEPILIFDDQRGQYVLRELGWTDENRVRQTRLHVTVRDDKIWIEEDWTEEGFATYLVAQGVPREDIVLAFQPPVMRPYTEFAVA